MNFEHTNLPMHIQLQIESKFNKRKKKEIKSKFKQKSIEIYMNNLRSASEIVTIHKMISFVDIKKLKKTKLIPFLIDLAGKQISPQLTTAIMNILISGYNISNITDIIFQNGGTQLFLELLESKVLNIKNAAICGLRLLNQSNQEIITIILNSGGLVKIIKIIQEQSEIQQYTINNFYEIVKAIPKTETKKIRICFDILWDLFKQNPNYIILNYLKYLLRFDSQLAQVIFQNNYINQLIDQLDQLDKLNNSVLILKLLTQLEHDITGYFQSRSINIQNEILKTGFLLKCLNYFNQQRKQYQVYFVQFKQVLIILAQMTDINAQFKNIVRQNEEIINQIMQIWSGSENRDIVQNVVQILTNLADQKENIQFFMEKGLFIIYKRILEREIYTVSTLEKIEKSIAIILKICENLRNSYNKILSIQLLYVIELKELGLDKMIQESSQYEKQFI